jgi:UDP-N-acetylmuramoylalanine--D-glutamate ligase
MKIAILGYGTEGKSVHRFLKRSKKYKSSQVEILDQKRDRNYLKRLNEFDLVFRTPGIPYLTLEIQQAIKKGGKISSATKLFFDEFKGIIIGVTGSKGKSTTATLIQKGLRACNEDVHLAGNIGNSPLDLLPRLKKTSVVVLELSSFQLQDLHKSPAIAVVLDVFPEHLDHHQNMREYVEAKKRICIYQKKGGMVFYFRDDELSKKIARFGKGKKIGISGKKLGLKKNPAMAAAVASCLGCDPDKVLSAIEKFKGLPHRMEMVRKIGNILFYNDSQSTNPHTVAMAILTLAKKPGSVVLIAGGRSKVPNYSPLRKSIRENGNVNQVILFGENRLAVKKALGKATKIKYADNLQYAIREAYEIAKKIEKKSQEPVHVILSPGSVSFDMFRDYKERGRLFKALVKKLK